jgi:hypothetical protein
MCEVVGSTDPQASRGMGDRPPLVFRCAIRGLARSVLTTAGLLARRQVRRPRERVGQVISFADGSRSRVYRETALARHEIRAPAVLVIAFKLRWVRGLGHAMFRAESLLNTPLFVGFPGLVSKLWLANDDNGTYRGVYQWDGPERAHAYARALWWALSLVSERGSIRYVVLPGRHRDEWLHESSSQLPGPDEVGAWWRVTATGPALR